jgi:mRNA interferase RelE/StbE
LSDEPWRLVIATSAERSLQRLPAKATAAVIEFMLGPLTNNPNRVGYPLRYKLSGLWSARRGPYRVAYELDEAAKTVRVVRIDHRADVYRPL